jgi:hypothetical protein
MPHAILFRCRLSESPPKQVRRESCMLGSAIDPPRVACDEPELDEASRSSECGVGAFGWQNEGRDMPAKKRDSAVPDDDAHTPAVVSEVRTEEALLKAGALQSAIFNSANFSSIATDAKGVVQSWLEKHRQPDAAGAKAKKQAKRSRRRRAR